MGDGGGVMVVADMKKGNFFTQRGFEPKKFFFLKKCVNYNKLNLQQNRIKGPKDPINAKKNKGGLRFEMIGILMEVVVVIPLYWYYILVLV